MQVRGGGILYLSPTFSVEHEPPSGAHVFTEVIEPRHVLHHRVKSRDQWSTHDNNRLHHYIIANSFA